MSDAGGFGCVVVEEGKKGKEGIRASREQRERIARIVRQRGRGVRECCKKRHARDASHGRRVGSLGTDKAYPEIRWSATALVESSVVVLRCRRRDRLAAQVTVISRFAHRSAAPTRCLESVPLAVQVSSGISRQSEEVRVARVTVRKKAGGNAL